MIDGMESYQVCAGPADKGGPDDFITIVVAASAEDACYRAGAVAMAERGLVAVDYVIKGVVSEREYVAGTVRVPPYVNAEQTEDLEGVLVMPGHRFPHESGDCYCF